MEVFALVRGSGAAELQHRKVFREEIRNAIREAIFAGELKPGDRIIETYWAKELGVSQGPVRGGYSGPGGHGAGGNCAV